MLLAGAVLIVVAAIPFLFVPDDVEAMIFGLFCGILVAMFVFAWPERSHERVELHSTYIERAWIRTLFFHWERVWERWEYSSIDQAAIVPRDRSGKWMSALVLWRGHSVKAIAIGRKVNLPELAQFLSSRGIRLSYADTVPKKALPKTFSRASVKVACVAACLMPFVAAIIRSNVFPNKGANGANRGAADPFPKVQPMAGMGQFNPNVPPFPQARHPFAHGLAPNNAGAGPAAGNHLPAPPFAPPLPPGPPGNHGVGGPPRLTPFGP